MAAESTENDIQYDTLESLYIALKVEPEIAEIYPILGKTFPPERLEIYQLKRFCLFKDVAMTGSESQLRQRLLAVFDFPLLDVEEETNQTLTIEEPPKKRRKKVTRKKEQKRSEKRIHKVVETEPKKRDNVKNICKECKENTDQIRDCDWCGVTECKHNLEKGAFCRGVCNRYGCSECVAVGELKQCTKMADCTEMVCSKCTQKCENCWDDLMMHGLEDHEIEEAMKSDDPKSYYPTDSVW